MAAQSADDFLQAHDGDLITYAFLYAEFENFLTTAIHTIAFERSVYPRGSFGRRSAFSFPVYESRDEYVCKWIKDVVDMVMVEVRKGVVSHLSVTIVAPGSIPVERYVFDTSRLPVLPADELARLVIGADMDGSGLLGPSKADLQAHFRAVLRTITACSASLSKLPKESTIGVIVELKDGVPEDFEEGWLPAAHLLNTKNSISGKQTPQQGPTQPLHSIRVNGISIPVWMEEAIKPSNDASSSRFLESIDEDGRKRKKNRRH